MVRRPPRLLLTSLLCVAAFSAGCAATGSITDGQLDPVGGARPGDDAATIDDGATPGNDSGTPATDGGTTSDSGVPSPDGVTPPPADTGGPPPVDSGGPPPADTDAPPPADTGTPPPADTGTMPTCGPMVPPTSGSCGSERWTVKTGADPEACTTSLSPTETTVAALRAIPNPGSLPSNSRIAPTETTVWELRDVTLVQYKQETDSDYHLVIADGSGATLIAEIPAPGCVSSGGAWYSLIRSARAAFDAKHSVGSGWGYGPETVTLRGMGFFDHAHGQTGLAPNAIELHSVLAICFGAGCTP